MKDREYPLLRVTGGFSHSASYQCETEMGVIAHNRAIARTGTVLYALGNVPIIVHRQYEKRLNPGSAVQMLLVRKNVDG